MITVYGIPNCDVIKKTVKWLNDNGIAYTFHDYRKDGIDEKRIAGWCDEAGLETLFNKRSTTWKELVEKTQASAADKRAAVRIMAEHPTIIKRPVIEKNGKVAAVGYDEKAFARL